MRYVVGLVGVAMFLCGVVASGWLWPARHQPPGEAAGAVVIDASGDAAAPAGPRNETAMPRSARMPVTLEIPAIAVATRLIGLGLMPDRTVEVPEDPDLAGWFRRGPRPGRPGSAVILGHVDSVNGPAVFARLQELRPGDTLRVGRADGSAVSFVVRRSVTYPNTEFPAARVYAAQGARRLNLVTCGGIYDSTRGGYQSNLVVYTRRVEMSESD